MSRRNKSKYPNLRKKLNTKLRQDYMDNIDYIHGVINDKGETVIRKLSDSELEFLNKFNAEYYNASFDKNDNNNLHANKASDEIIHNIKEDISALKKKIKKEYDVDNLKVLYAELEEMTEYLVEIYPKKERMDANNARNRCILNKGKAEKKLSVIPWEEEERYIEIDQDSIFNYFEKVDEDDEIDD